METLTRMPTTPDTSSPPPLACLPPRIDSGQLLGSHRVIEIEHGGTRYMLRVTKDNKLILTK